MARVALWLLVSGLVIPLRIVWLALRFGPQLVFFFLLFGEFALALSLIHI